MLWPTPLMLPPTAAAASPAKPPAVDTTFETVGARASETLLSTQVVAIVSELGRYVPLD